MLQAFVVLLLLGAVYDLNSSLALGQKCTKVVDIALVVDESGSIREENFEKIRQYLVDITSKFDITPFGVHFGLIKYSTNPRLVFPFSKYTEELKEQIRTMEYKGGSTKTGKALDFIAKHFFHSKLDRMDVPNVVIIFSDGASHDHSRALKITSQMKDDGVTVLCVGIGRGRVDKTLQRQLRELASKEEYVFQTTFKLLQTIENALVKEVCESIDPCKAKPCLNNGRCIRTGDDTYTCVCPDNFEGPKCELPKWCQKASFTKQGCYSVKNIIDQKENLIFNRRNEIDWYEGWDDFIEKLVCDCAGEAQKRGYRFFWIEFFGECWGYRDLDFSKLTHKPKDCWGKRPNYDECMVEEKNPVCIGKANTGYIYKLKELSNVINN